MRIGILGGGQLGRMLALAGYPLGLRFRVLDPSPLAPAGHGAELIVAAYDDPAALERLAVGCEIVTYEFENVPSAALELLKHRTPVLPPLAALQTAQDRLYEKELFRDLGIPTPVFAEVATRHDLAVGLERIGVPSILKTRRLGYDGKGQAVILNVDAADTAWAALGASGAPFLLEDFVPFDRELSVLAVRGRSGETAFYSLVENHHSDGILRLSRAPLPNLPTTLQSMAEDYAARVLQALDYVGVLALELFEIEGKLLANEMACRVHNSGHWTIEGAVTSQFENHLRAILGWPLGSTAAVGHSIMVNVIGQVPDLRAVLGLAGAHVHLYGKTPAQARKLGHITLWDESEGAVAAQLKALQAIMEASIRENG